MPVILGLIILLGVALAICLSIRGSLPVFPLPKIRIEHWRFGTLTSEVAARTGYGGRRIRLIMNGLTSLRNPHFLGVGPANAEYHLQRMLRTEAVHSLIIGGWKSW